MSLVKVVDLALSLFLPDHRLTFVVPEALENTLMVELHLLLLLLLLLELEAHELILLLGDGSVLYGLALHGFVFSF